MKNLVMSLTSNFDWYKMEPFITSFKKYNNGADLVIFAADISDFTRDILTKWGAEVIPYTLNSILELGYLRWDLAKKFLDARGDDYHQVFLTDLRDVIFQGDVFEAYADLPSFLGYVTEGMTIKNPFESWTYRWLKQLFGEETAEKLGNKEIICAGTTLGTVDAMKILCNQMLNIINGSTRIGDDQATENYLIYENMLPIENIIEINCNSGNILTAGIFYKNDPVRIVNEKILRGDGGVPAAIHQYDRHPVFVELVNKIYRRKKFQFNEKFNDPRSMLEQFNYLVHFGKIDDAYKLFTKHLFGKNFEGFNDLMISLWERILEVNITPTTELLILSIQSALMSTSNNVFTLEQVEKICHLTSLCIDKRLVVSYTFKTFLGNNLFLVSKYFYEQNQLDNCLVCIDFIATLDIPLGKDFYLIQARIYREAGKVPEAIIAYQKALEFLG